MANIKDVRQTIAEGAAISLTKNKALIDRRINIALEDIDSIVEWNFAIKSFEKDITVNKNSVSVGSDMIFHPVFCKVTMSDDTWPLNYISLTDFERQTANISTVNNYPTLYSVGGNRLYVGPGLLGSAAVIEGKYQRKLTINDIPNLPASLVINRALMGMLKAGTPQQIAAWSGWKSGVKSIQETYKVTAETRSYNYLDEQVQINMAYLDSLD